MPIDYSKAKIYAIRAPDCSGVYIGSTCNLLCVRMGAHKYSFKKWSENTEAARYTASFEVLKHQGAYIELLEAYSCNSREELNKREGEYIRTTPGCVNSQIAGRSRKESSKDYHEANKETINDKRRIRWFFANKYAFLD